MFEAQAVPRSLFDRAAHAQLPARIAVLFAVVCAPTLGCSGGAGSTPPTEDTRVDHPGKADNSEASAPRTCMTEDGVLNVVWEEDRGRNAGIWFNVSDDGGKTWLTSDIAINHGDADATAPDVACAGRNVYVTWEDERDGELANHNIYAAVSTDGGQSFGEEDILLDGDADGKAMSLGPRAAAVGDDVYVAWFDNRDGAYDIYVQASHDRGRTWMEDATRADDDDAGSAYSAWPTIGASVDGVVVAWEDSRGGGNDIYASVSTDGGRSFENETRLDAGDDAGASNSFEPRLVLDGSMAAVTWYDERNGARDIYLNVTTDTGSSWSADAIRVESDPEGEADSLHPAIATRDGLVYVAWQDSRAGGYDIFERTYAPDSGEFSSEEVRVDTDADGESQSYYPQIAVGGENVYIVWQDYREDKGNVGFNDLRYNYSADGGTNWNSDDLRVNSNEPGSSYAVNASANIVGKNFVSVWSDGRSGTADIYSAKRTLGDESVYVAPKKDAAAQK
jgi:hypothetical protein